MPDNERRLAAIMFTDMVGYAALTQSDESQALEVLERHNKLVRPFFQKFNGKEVKTIGDSFLVEFESALDATNCAMEIQSLLHDYNLSSRNEWKVNLRIGIHLGDVVHKYGDVFGDAVNIASRIEAATRPEGICISQQVYDQVRNKVPFGLVKMGPMKLKNVGVPIDAYSLVMPWEEGRRPRDEPSSDRIAVLPFVNMSPDPNDEYFADGMTEELIDRLAQVKSLRVIARTSVMSYKGEKKKAAEIAKELDVGTLVEGSVRKSGNRVRISVQLISGGAEEHLWSSHYDGNLDDIFAVQSEIAEKVAGELKVQLLKSEKQTLERKPTENTEAYSDFLRGRELYREEKETSIRRALCLFEKAIGIDPAFARAYVGLADCHQWLGNSGYEPLDIVHPKVKSLLKRALELDPDLPEAHASLSEVHYNDDDLLEAEAEARRAMELNPSFPNSYSMLAELAAIKGDPQEYVRLKETAYRLDPIRPRFIDDLRYAYFHTGREKEALEHWRKTGQLAPASTYQSMADYYLCKGDVEKAKEFHAKAEKLEPTSPRVITQGGVIAAVAGDREGALLAIKKIEDAKIGPLAFNLIGFIYHDLGDLDSYFEYMNRALEAKLIIAVIVMYSPLLARARSDPRYQGLVEKIRRPIGQAK